MREVDEVSINLGLHQCNGSREIKLPHLIDTNLFQIIFDSKYKALLVIIDYNFLKAFARSTPTSTTTEIRNCFLKHVIEGKRERKIEVTGRGGGRGKQLLDDLKETRGCWKLKE